MSERLLMKGNEAVAEAAIYAGCRFFFGYPITPQNEIPEYMSRRLPEVGGTFIQAESELAAINMVYGASGAGVRVMTSSSSPGITLKQEGLSYMAAAELPCVVVNMVRGGPGLGGIQPAQSDYFQATRGGGHGDYRTVVMGPASVQELVDVTIQAFEIADRYRIPVKILGDGILGQMMEPVTFPEEYSPGEFSKPWKTTGKGSGPKRLINSLYLQPEACEQHNLRLRAKHDQITAAEVRCSGVMTDDADLLFVAYGTTARIARTAVDMLRTGGIRAGLFRPISLWPFPSAQLAAAAKNARSILVVEMSLGQMLEDVRLTLGRDERIRFFGHTGGVIPGPRELFDQARLAIEGVGELS